MSDSLTGRARKAIEAHPALALTLGADNELAAANAELAAAAAERTGQSPEDVVDMAAFGVMCNILEQGARRSSNLPPETLDL